MGCSPVAQASSTIEGRNGSEKSIERDSTAKTVASQPWLDYPSCAGMAKMEILAQERIDTRKSSSLGGEVL